MRTWRLSLDTHTASGIICTQGSCHPEDKEQKAYGYAEFLVYSKNEERNSLNFHREMAPAGWRGHL